MTRPGLAIMALAAALSGRAAAQAPPNWMLTGVLSAAWARQAVGIERERAGTWFGGGLQADYRKIAIAVRGQFGGLDATDDASARVRLTDVSVRYRLPHGLSLGLDAQALRSLDTGVTSLRRLAGPALGATVSLGLPGLWAETDAALYVLRTGANDDAIRQALRVDVGIRYSFDRYPLDVSVAFRRETFSFSAPRPPESLGGLVLTARARLLPRGSRGT